MGKEKAGPMTPKAIANRMKMKGLQKLKFYCQMCEKQCRDENGFKCHLMSESHQRQLLLFAEQPGKFLDTFSNEFLKEYMRLLKHRFGTKRVLANAVYQEYISDRGHIHMNATKWQTLTGFVKWLGRTGLCRVDETEKGWFVQYIDRSPEALAREREREKKTRLERTDEERTWMLIEKARERELAKTATGTSSSANEPHADSDDDVSSASSDDQSGEKSGEESSEEKQVEGGEQQEEKPEAEAANEHKTTRISFKLPAAAPASVSMRPSTSSKLLTAPMRLDNTASSASSRRDSEPRPTKKETTVKSDKNEAFAAKRKGSTLSEIIDEDERRKAKERRKDGSCWLQRGLMVRIRDDARGELAAFRLKRATVLDVDSRPRSGARVRIGDVKLRVEEADVQTVLPKLGERVQVVHGSYRGELALLQRIDDATCTCSIRLLHGSLRDRVVDRVNCDDVCKLSEDSH